MDLEPAQTLPDDPKKPKQSPALALVVAFLPSVLLIGLLWGGTHGKEADEDLLSIACFVSIICCFASAFMLFRRNTSLAVMSGIMFLLLNAAISFFFGCAAALNNI